MADTITLSFGNQHGTKYIKYRIDSCEGEKKIIFSVPSSASSWCSTGETASADTISVSVTDNNVSERSTTISVYLNNDPVCEHKINVSQSSCPGDCGSIISISFNNVSKDGAAANSVVGHYSLKDGCPTSNLSVDSDGISLTLSDDGRTIRNLSEINANEKYEAIKLATATFNYNNIGCSALTLYQDGQLCSCDAMKSSYYVNAMIGRDGTGGRIVVASADTMGCGYISATTESNMFENGISIEEVEDKYYLYGSIGGIPSGQQTRVADITVSYMHKGESYDDCPGVLYITQYDVNFPCPFSAIDGKRTNYKGYDDAYTSEATTRSLCYYTFQNTLNSTNKDAYLVYIYNEDPNDDSWLSFNCLDGCTPYTVDSSHYYLYGFAVTVYLTENKTQDVRSSNVKAKIVNRYTGQVCWTANIIRIIQPPFDCCSNTLGTITTEGLANYASLPNGETKDVLFNKCVTDVLVNGISVYNTTPLVLKDSNNNDFMSFYADRYTSDGVEYMRLQIETYSNPGTTVRNINYTLTLTTDGEPCEYDLKNGQIPICDCDYIRSKITSGMLEYSFTPFDAEGSIKSYDGKWGQAYYHKMFNYPGAFGCEIRANDFRVETVDVNKQLKSYDGLSLEIKVRWEDSSNTNRIVALIFKMDSNFVNQIVYFKVYMYGCDFGYYKASFIGYDGGGGEPSYDCLSVSWDIQQLDSEVAPLDSGTYQVPVGGATIKIAELGGSFPNTDFRYWIDSTQPQYFTNMYIAGGFAYVEIPANDSHVTGKNFTCTVRGQFKEGDCYTKNFHFYQKKD